MYFSPNFHVGTLYKHCVCVFWYFLCLRLCIFLKCASKPSSVKIALANGYGKYISNVGEKSSRFIKICDRGDGNDDNNGGDGDGDQVTILSSKDSTD